LTQVTLKIYLFQSKTKHGSLFFTVQRNELRSYFEKTIFLKQFQMTHFSMNEIEDFKINKIKLLK